MGYGGRTEGYSFGHLRTLAGKMQRFTTFRLSSLPKLRISCRFNVFTGINEPYLPLKWVNRAMQSANEGSIKRKETLPKQKIKKLTSISRILEFSAKEKRLDQSSRVAAFRRLAQIASLNERDSAVGKSRLLFHTEKQKTQYGVLLDDIALNITESNQQDMAAIVWSLARLGVRDPWLVEECEKRLLQFDFTTFSDRQISIIAWGFVQIGNAKSKPLFERVKEDMIRRGIRDLKDRELSMLLIAFSDPALKDDRVFGLFEQDILLGNLGAYDDVVLMQCVLSFAKAGQYSSALFDAIGDELAQRDLSKFSSRGLADTLWSYAKVNINHKRLVRELKGEIAVRSLSKFTTSHLGKITWALTKLKVVTPADKLFAAVEDEILQRNPSLMGEVDIVQIIWSFAQAQVKNDRLFHFIGVELTKRDLSSSPNGHLCQIAWAFTRKNIKAHGLLENVWNEIDARGLSTFEDKERMLLENAKHFVRQ